MEKTKYYNLSDVDISLVIGMAGSGKQRCYIEPILKDLNNECCIVIDSRRVLYEKYKNQLIEKGYDVKILDIENPDSNTYNPFDYLNTDNDCIELAHSIIKNTTNKNEDYFYKEGSEVLLTAFISYIHMEYNGTNKHNFSEVNNLCLLAHNHFDIVKDRFNNLRKTNPDCLAVIKFDTLLSACKGKILNNIIMELAAKLSIFNIPNVNNTLLTSDKNIDIKSLLDTNTVVFLKISLNDLTYDFIHNIFLMQVFDMLRNNNPKKLRIILDEFQRLNLSFDTHMFLQLCYIIDKYNNASCLKIDFIIQSISQIKHGAYYDLLIQGNNTIICLGVIGQEDFFFFNKLANINVSNLKIEELLVIKKNGFKVSTDKYKKVHIV
jgi:type IV secretory pathway TraG/TraD family ATPase VirD4